MNSILNRQQKENRRQGRLDGGQTFRIVPIRPMTGWESASLFQVVLGQVDRELGDEGRAAPVGALAKRVDRRDVRASRRGVVAGKGVAIALVQVGIVVAQIERELLPGKSKANVPSGVVFIF